MNQEIIKEFFDEHEYRYSFETIRSYRISLKQFFSHCNKDYQLVRPTDVRAWLASLVEKELKPRSIHIKLSGVKSFYQYCMEENLIKKNPTLTIRSPHVDERAPYYLNKMQLALLQEITKEDIRDRAMVEALYATGVRISELLNIRLEDIKWETKQIWIREGKGNKERFVLFTHECEARIKVYLSNRKIQNEFLFSNQRGGQLSRDFVEKQFARFSEKLGFRVTPHTLRHTFAAHLAEKNMRQSYIQELLGHTNINSTRIYTRLMNSARKKKYDQYQI